jgi:UrcA family protein
MRKFIRIASMAVIAGSGALVAAQESPDGESIRSKTVTFDPASIRTDAGVEDFYQRLRSAARDVCIDEGYPRVMLREEAQSCAAEAVERAVRDVNQSALTDIHLRDGEVNVGAIENE